MSKAKTSELKKTRLIEEGVAAFLEHGYHGTGIKEVLDRVKIPKGSFYNYFESKEDFAAAAIRHYGDCLGQKMSEALASEPDPVSGLRAFFERLMDEFQDAGFVGGCLVANLGGELEGSETCRLALATAFGDWREGVRDALGEAQGKDLVRKDIDAGELSDMLIEAWEGAVIRMKIERSVEPLEKCIHRFFDVYFQP